MPMNAKQVSWLVGVFRAAGLDKYCPMRDHLSMFPGRPKGSR